MIRHGFRIVVRVLLTALIFPPIVRESAAQQAMEYTAAPHSLQLSLTDYVHRTIDENLKEIFRKQLYLIEDRRAQDLPLPVIEEAVERALVRAQDDPVIGPAMETAYNQSLPFARRRTTRKETDTQAVQKKIDEKVRGVLSSRDIEKAAYSLAEAALDQVLSELSGYGLWPSR